MIKVLSECGNSLREPYTKYLSNGIFELRIISSGNHIRLLFFYKDKRTIVLTNGFVKKTAKTPKKELELAIKRKTEYLSRGETNEEL